MGVPKLVFVSFSFFLFLWGGVVGEVGIKIVQQDASGRMQKYIVMVQTAFF